MISPTNYHIPTHVAEGLAKYHRGFDTVECSIPDREIDFTYDILSEITDPNLSIKVGLGQIAGREVLFIEDDSRPRRNLGIFR